MLTRTLAILSCALAWGLAGASQISWTGLEVSSLAQAPDNPDLLYAGANPGLFRSRDHGRHWEPMKLPAPVRHASVVVHPEQPGRLFVLLKSPKDDPSPAYYESIDAGASWTSHGSAPLGGREPVGDQYDSPRLKIDSAAVGGTWWMVAGDSLLRSRDEGRTWTRSAEAGALQRDHGKLMRLSKMSVLYQSLDNGETWTEVHTFTELQKPRTATSGFMVLPDGSYMVHSAGLWQQSTDGGAHWTEAANGFQTLPDHGLPKPGDFPYRTGCQIEVAPSDGAAMLARCYFSDGANPTSNSLYWTGDGGHHWTTPSWEHHNGLPGWYPIAMLWDAHDVLRLVWSWAGGGIYQTQDGGLHWERTDVGLRYRWEQDFLGMEALQEPPLYQAVMYRDRQALHALLAAGAVINAPGNYLGSVLEADLRATRYDSKDLPYHAPLYFELRSLGAHLPGDRPDPDMLETAAKLRRDDILDDLVDDGYNWRGRPEVGMASLRHLDEAQLTRWLAFYTTAGTYYAVDEMVAQLLTMEKEQQALALFRAASRTRPFDRQTGPAAPAARTELLKNLIDRGQYPQAGQLYATLTFESQQQARESLVDLLANRCDFALLQRVASTDADVRCLPKVSQAQRLRLLQRLDDRRALTEGVWLDFMKLAAYRWTLQTAVYRRHAAQIEPLRGVVGLSFNWGRETGQPVLVSGVRPGSPATRAGVREGDRLLAIDDANTDGLSSDALVQAIRGRPGSTVGLTLRRGGDTFRLNLKRQALDTLKAG